MKHENVDRWDRRIVVVLFLAVFVMTPLFQGCGGRNAAEGGAVTLILGAYTTPREAYGKAIIPAFQK
ncbi:MAG TPA: hypothetical protein VFO63_06005, partial [Blastocatellia bacterium]|nr:hypothetical protein [Blastocatellia bacterium]